MHSLICTFYLATVFLFSAPSHAANDDDDSAAAIQKQAPNALPTQASDNTSPLQNAGIETERLQASSQQAEFIAYGSVVNVEPLLAIRQQTLAARAQQDSAAARYQEADANLNRTRDLHQQDIVSTRRLQEQQAQWRNEKANLATSSYQQQTIVAASRLQWGDILTQWFTNPHDDQAEQFLNHRAQLLQITLPAGASMPANTHTIAVDERGRRDKAVSATFISQAPQVDPVTQGARFLFQCGQHNLPFGAHITAWIPSGNQEKSGVVIPENAVIWHLGQAFVFIKTGTDQYSRRLLTELVPNVGGYFAATGFNAGEEIVTTGAQTLLSEELKSQIPSEDND